MCILFIYIIYTLGIYICICIDTDIHIIVCKNQVLLIRLRVRQAHWTSPRIAFWIRNPCPGEKSRSFKSALLAENAGLKDVEKGSKIRWWYPWDGGP